MSGWPLAQAEAVEISYPTDNPETSLVRFRRSLSDTDGRVTLLLEVSNVTKEGEGNGREVVVEGLTIEEPLPSEALLRLAEARPTRGTVGWTRPELKPCRPFILDAAYGFSFGRSELTPGMQRRMRAWVDRLPSEGRWTVVGFSDQLGTPAANHELAKQRAAAGREFLLGAGLTRKRMGSTGLNDDALVTDAKDGRALNRRVELYPADHPRLSWRIQALRPGEVAKLELQLSPGPFHRPGSAELWFAEGPCLSGSISHDSVSPTRPRVETTVNVRQETPFGQRSGPDDLSYCEPFELDVAWRNDGARSAKDVILRVAFPPKLELGTEVDEANRSAANGRQWLSWRIESLAAGASLKRTLPLRAPSESDLAEQPGHPVLVPVEVVAGNRNGASPRVRAEKAIDLRFQRPELVLEVRGLPSRIFPGEPVKARLEVRNAGTFTVDDLVLVALLPADAESLPGDTDGPASVLEGGLRKLTWSVGQLGAGATAGRDLHFRVASNEVRGDYPMEFVSYERRYGSPEANSCAVDRVQIARRVVSLIPPEIRMSVAEEVIKLGDRVSFRTEVVNRNPIPQSYRVQGRLDPKIWERVENGHLEAASSDAPENRPVRVAKREDGLLQLEEHDGSAFRLTLPPGGRAVLELEAQARGLSEDALTAASGSLVSEFDLSGLELSAEHVHGLAEGGGRIELLIYR